MRESVSDPASTGYSEVDSYQSDYQAVDETPGFFMNLVNFFLKIWWIVFIVLGLAALAFPYLFPQWSANYEEELREMGIAANTGKFVENARKVDWKSAFGKVNLQNLYLVGTGLHPEFRKNKALKEGAWYTGQVFIMKRYVRERDWLNYLNVDTSDLEGDINSPATGVEQDDAAEYCQAQGGRLPTWSELDLAHYWAFIKFKQGKTGKFIKSNLVFDINPTYRLWTSSPEGDSFSSRDNFQIYTAGKKDLVFEDDGHEAENLSFVCVVGEK